MNRLKAMAAACGIAALMGTTGVLVGCKHMDSDEHEHGSAHVHKYVCTMHPDVVQITPGKCPKCGMDLVHKD